jgi:queuine/archaeosine tRNA-ribosyltransferase
MKFYFPDSQDQVSPTFDFITEDHSPYRVRQRDDLYAHEVLAETPYDGILVSKAMVDGTVNGAGKYSEAQRSRLYRYGVRKFFRLPEGMESLGDCGAFNYINETEPPYTVSQVADFYENCGFDAGVSVDHVILGYQRGAGLTGAPEAWQQRRAISLRYAADFLHECDKRGTPFQPFGAAQGWDPQSYADSVDRLQKMGYRRIALGGMVSLKTKDILEVLMAIDQVRTPGIELHLLGITRVDSMVEFALYGVTSFDSTAPFRQAFMDDRDNYQTADGHFAALRVPQVDANVTLKRRVLAGEVDQGTLVKAEQNCLRTLEEVNKNPRATRKAIRALADYEALIGIKKSYLEEYERMLDARPWTKCSCTLCQEHGIQIAIFRGAERNKRRGFHNLYVFGHRMRDLHAKEEVA